MPRGEGPGSSAEYGTIYTPPKQTTYTARPGGTTGPGRFVDMLTAKRYGSRGGYALNPRLLSSRIRKGRSLINQMQDQQLQSIIGAFDPLDIK